MGDRICATLCTLLYICTAACICTLSGVTFLLLHTLRSAPHSWLLLLFFFLSGIVSRPSLRSISPYVLYNVRPWLRQSQRYIQPSDIEMIGRQGGLPGGSLLSCHECPQCGFPLLYRGSRERRWEGSTRCCLFSGRAHALLNCLLLLAAFLLPKSSTHPFLGKSIKADC